MSKQSLQQKLLQKLSPQQIKLMKLIQLSTVELENRIDEELSENPALEDNKMNDSEDLNSWPAYSDIAFTRASKPCLIFGCILCLKPAILF